MRGDAGAERVPVDDDVLRVDAARAGHPVVDRPRVAVERFLVERTIITRAVAAVVERDDPDALGEQGARPLLAQRE
jgi:hypothetical protein